MKKELVYTELIAQLSLTVVKPLVFIIALSPFVLAVINCGLHSGFKSYIVLSACALLFPVLVLIIIALLFRMLPDVPNGKHAFYSYYYYVWLFKDLTHETVVTSAFLNNLVRRVKPVGHIFYTIIKMPNTRHFILANDVRVLDPDRVTIGEFTFVGINTILSGHIIRSGKLVLEQINIGKNNIIGAFCAVACGVTTGDNCKIDSFVTLNNNVSIGENSVVLGKSLIDSRVKIGKNVRIGKCCIVGANTVIEDGAIIGDYLRVGSNKLIQAKQIISTDML